MNKSNKFSLEAHERAVRLVLEHRGEYPSLWLAIESIALKIGCVPQTILTWVKRHEIDSGVREGVATTEAQRVRELEREVKALRRANGILNVASRFFAKTELDRRFKVGSKGDSYDNALAETINGLYKAEVIYRRAPWKIKEALKLVTLEWGSWFNHHRMLEPIGHIPPAEAEANYYRHLADWVAVAARLKPTRLNETRAGSHCPPCLLGMYQECP